MTIFKILPFAALVLAVPTMTQAQDAPEAEATEVTIDKKETAEYKKQLATLTEGMTTTASGLKYKITKKTGGQKPKKGELVHVHYKGTLVDGTIFDTSAKRGKPLPLKLGVGMVIKGWDEGIALLGVGEKATLVIPGNLAYGQRGSGKIIGPDETLVFEVELVEIQDLSAFKTEGIKPIELENGIKIFKTKTTEDLKATPGNVVVLHYSGYLEGNKRFDTSYNRMKPLQFYVGKGQVIKGLDLAVAHLRKGERARVVIPGELGYGAAGAGNGAIPPNATLMFDLDVVEVVDMNNQNTK